MAEMRPAPAAMHLDALHAEAAVGRRPERAGEWIEEAGPARSAFKFLSGPKKRLVATCAVEVPGSFFVVEDAAARPLRPMSAHHMVLLVSQARTPFRVRECHRELFVLHSALSKVTSRFDPIFYKLESVRRHYVQLHNFLIIIRIEARYTNARALRLRHSQSLASLRHLPSHANVRSTTHRLARTSNP